LASVLAAHAVQRLIVAGDLFEESYCGPMVTQLLDWLYQRGVELTGVVAGNHDRGLEKGKDQLPLFPEGVELGGWRIVHGDGALPPGRLVLGHFHPCLRWTPRLAAPCYLVGPDQLLLPAYSADAAGVSVLRQERWQSYHCYGLVGSRVLDFGEVGTLRRKAQGSGIRKLEGRTASLQMPDP
jgi:metallophosphoesterase superfamily enzyme